MALKLFLNIYRITFVDLLAEYLPDSFQIRLLAAYIYLFYA